MNRHTVIDVRDLTFGYRAEPALKGVSLSIQQGDFLALVGPNGSGKTTLLKLLLGILAPERGTVSLYDRPLESYAPKERATKIAYVSQQPASSFPLTVFELVSLGRYPYTTRFGHETADAKAVEEALALTDSASLRERKFPTLSGGEKQKVLIARALAQSTRILLLDEPTVHLDLYYQMEILKTLKRLCTERGTTVVAVLHEINLVSLFADKVAMLRSGRIRASGEARAVMNAQNIKDVFGVKMAAQDDAETGARYFLPRDPLDWK